MKKRVLLMMDAPRVRPLYVRLLERRGHEVQTAVDLEKASEIISCGEVHLAVLDTDLSHEPFDDLLARWRRLNDSPLLVLLRSRESRHRDLVFDTHLADLVLQKPLSPIEFGVQIDHLFESSQSSSLEEDSRAEQEFGAMKEAFIETLGEEFLQIQRLWQEVDQNHQSPMRAAGRMRRTVAPLRAAAGHFGFPDLSDELTALDSFLRRLMTPTATVEEIDRRRAHLLLQGIQQSCRAIEQQGKAHFGSHRQGQQTLLVVDPDLNFLRQIERYGEQFMVRIRSAETLAEAEKLAQSSLLLGALVSLSATQSSCDLPEALSALQRVCGDALPVVLLAENNEEIDQGRALWPEATMLATKPLSASAFSQIANHLTGLVDHPQASIFIIEAERDRAAFLDAELSRPDTALAFFEPNRSLIDQLDEHRPDLVLMNAHLPNLSSFDVCRTIRAIPRWQDLPVVMVVNQDKAETRLAAYQAGVDDFFSYAIHPDELTARIQTRLQRTRLLRERADRDLLTGLLTRRAFLEQFAARMSEAERHQRSLAFCILDVDHFKAVNDTHGHPAGDDVLRTLGQLLQDRFRVEDLRARWGGEEFTVVLVDEDAPTARMVLNRVLTEFSRLHFQGQNNRSFQVTFSAGIASFPEDGRDGEALLNAADARLLDAKRSGRNTIIAGRQTA